MKRVVLCLLGALALSAVGVAPATAAETFRAWVATDVHYLADRLHDAGPRYQRLLSEGDNKNTDLVGALVDTLVQKALGASAESRPDCLILAGDLTFNGEALGHAELADRLRPLVQAGIPVYVLPGNHDLQNPYARYFTGETATLAETVTPDQFAALYRDFGFGTALSRDEETLSYLVEPRPGVRILMLDSTISGDNLDQGYPEVSGQIGEGTRRWIAQCARQATADGAQLLVAMHHSLLDHNAVINAGYTVEDSGTLANLFASLGIRSVFTGHTHVQDVAQADTPSGRVYDLTTGALSVFPHHYAEVTFPVGGPAAVVEYDSRTLDIGAGADQFFADRTASMMSCLVDGLELSWPADQRARLVALLVKLNTRFFEGLEDDNATDPEIQLALPLLGWLPDGFLASYARSIVDDPTPEDNCLAILPVSGGRLTLLRP
jgi:3',5'-cyclic AMP phosphodiesterase CpdA